MNNITHNFKRIASFLEKAFILCGLIHLLRKFFLTKNSLGFSVSQNDIKKFFDRNMALFNFQPKIENSNSLKIIYLLIATLTTILMSGILYGRLTYFKKRPSLILIFIEEKVYSQYCIGEDVNILI